MLHRIEAGTRAVVRIELDGEWIEARAGDTLLTAILLHRCYIRHSEFDDGPRAGFCLMGACQECWIWIDAERRVRACTTLAEQGMRVSASAPP